MAWKYFIGPLWGESTSDCRPPPPLPHTIPQPQTHTGIVLLSGFQSSRATLDSHEKNNNCEIKRVDNAISFDIIFSVNLTKLLNKEWSFWYLSILEVYKWISNFIPHFIMDVITFPYWDWSQTMLVKGAPVSRYHLYCQFLDMIFTTLWEVAWMRGQKHGGTHIWCGNYTTCLYIKELQKFTYMPYICIIEQ